MGLPNASLAGATRALMATIGIFKLFDPQAL